MEHQVLYRRDGYYSGFPHIDQLRDGRLAVRLTSSLHGDHYRVGLTGKKIVLVSDDEGRSWAESDDPSVPYNWAGGFGYEHSDSFAAVMADGTYVSAGVIRWEIWPVERSREAANQGFEFDPHPEDEGSIVVGVNKAFARRSTDQGQTWASRYWRIPGFGVATDFSRCAVLEDGTILVPVYGNDVAGNPQSFVWRSGDSGVSWRLISTGPHASGVRTDETAYVEVSPGRVLGLSRNETGYFSEAWSDDGGLTWSHPLLTDIWAPSSPAHLLKLRDGRILCTYGLRRAPMGIRAVLSEDEGQTWDTDNTVILREDGGTPSGLKFPPREEVDLEELRLGGEDFRRAVDREVIGRSYPSQNARSDVGYPVSVQLSDDAILSVYYITLSDGVTHSAATRWVA